MSRLIKALYLEWLDKVSPFLPLQMEASDFFFPSRLRPKNISPKKMGHLPVEGYRYECWSPRERSIIALKRTSKLHIIQQKRIQNWTKKLNSLRFSTLKVKSSWLYTGQHYGTVYFWPISTMVWCLLSIWCALYSFEIRIWHLRDVEKSGL